MKPKLDKRTRLKHARLAAENAARQARIASEGPANGLTSSLKRAPAFVGQAPGWHISEGWRGPKKGRKARWAVDGY